MKLFDSIKNGINSLYTPKDEDFFLYGIMTP